MENIKLSGAKNVRDFGNIINKDGKRIKPHCFIRGNVLSDLTDKDIKKLVNEYNLGVVIDLRTKTEAEEKPDKIIPGVEYIHIPVIRESTMGISHEEEIDKTEMLNHIPDLRQLYHDIIKEDYSVSQLKKVFEVIADTDREKAVLWHCTEGKDRCGITSALFLSLMNVDIKTIYEDYMMTNNASSKNAKKYYFLILLMTKSREKANGLKGVFRAEKEYLDSAFSAINEDWGSVENFIKDGLGISDEVREKMQSIYLF